MVGGKAPAKLEPTAETKQSGLFIDPRKAKTGETEEARQTRAWSFMLKKANPYKFAMLKTGVKPTKTVKFADLDAVGSRTAFDSWFAGADLYWVTESRHIYKWDNQSDIASIMRSF